MKRCVIARHSRSDSGDMSCWGLWRHSIKNMHLVHSVEIHLFSKLISVKECSSWLCPYLSSELLVFFLSRLPKKYLIPSQLNEFTQFCKEMSTRRINRGLTENGKSLEEMSQKIRRYNFNYLPILGFHNTG